MRLIECLRKTNCIDGQFFSYQVDGKRMSGEMNTSEGNGLMNIIITFFICEELGNKYYDGYFEGDDGIVGVDLLLPRAQHYLDLGAMIKIEKPADISEASFCGIIFHPDANDNVTDPVEALMSFAYAGQKYIYANQHTKLALLRCKALSMLYSYPGCPILRNLALYGLRVTDHIHQAKLIKTMNKLKAAANQYEKELYTEMFAAYLDKNISSKIVHMSTRYLVAQKYGISVQNQLDIESYLDNKCDLAPMYIPQFSLWTNEHQRHFYSTYGVAVTVENNVNKRFKFVVPAHRPYKVWRNAQTFEYY